ncbi:aquaporin [Kribbella italica]|uniref:Aquaporin Z n=1 Tax=Kribbella italica TaxID=1540520 RepID=A0A7W9MZQ6_9ACTN|nr:aquaporin [Kribbella italica]MBB5841622.1 aquaporin Z [Kribbella italica]
MSAAETVVPQLLVRRVLAEFAGGVLLVFLGISAMIAVTWVAEPLADWPGGRYLLSLLLGLAFGYAVTLVVYSPLGRISGQLNPSFTLVHWMAGWQSARTTAFYLVAQLVGGALGGAALLVWRARGAEFRYGATVPMPQVSLWIPAVAELVSTMLIALAIIAIARGRVTGSWAFHLVPILYGVLAPVAAPLSGLSTNPARTLGPALVADQYEHLWFYFVVPPLGAVLAVLVSPSLWPRNRQRILPGGDAPNDDARIPRTEAPRASGGLGDGRTRADRTRAWFRGPD